MRNLSKIIIYLLCGIFIYAAAYADGYEAKVDVQYAKVYESKDTDSRILRTLTKGVDVIVLEIQDKWCYISTNENKGWILKSDLKIMYDKKVLSIKKEKEEDTKEKTVNKSEPITYLPTSKSISPLRYGLKAGLIASKLFGDYVNDDYSEIRYGLVAGGYTIYNFTRNFGFQAEVLYAQKGGKGPVSGDDVTIKFDYIEVPIMLRYQLEPANSFYFNFGFCFGVLVNNAMVNSSKTYVFQDLKKVDYGLVLSAGYQYTLSDKYPLNFDIRYYYGLTTVNDDTNPNPVDVKNSALYFTVGIDL